MGRRAAAYEPRLPIGARKRTAADEARRRLAQEGEGSQFLPMCGIWQVHRIGECMSGESNIVVCDESALFYYLHCDTLSCQRLCASDISPLDSYARTISELQAFNTEHPLFGGEPVSVFALARKDRPHSKSVVGRLLSTQLPAESFLKMREGLYLASPELVLARMASRVSEIELMEIGINLCGRYYIDASSQIIRDRSCVLTTPDEIKLFLESVWRLRGSGKASRVLKWVLPNSGSPFESKMKLQFCNPLNQGSFALPFNAMNYNVSSKALQGYSEQSEYCIDLASPKRKAGMEYDGEPYHQDLSKDKRRLNALKAIGWDVFPIDKSVLMSPDATIRVGHQIAQTLGIRLRKPANWETKFVELREKLKLPV